MSSVWYVGPSDARVVAGDDWDRVGVDSTDAYRWDQFNGYSYPTTAFTTDQLAWLDSRNEEFWVGAPDGPRTVVVVAPEQYVTLNQLREFLGNYQFDGSTGLSKASVGLARVDNTSDAEKPLSILETVALGTKLDAPRGGVDGQFLVKAGDTVLWGSPTASGGTLAVTVHDDPDVASGKGYTVTGTGVAERPDPDLPSGTIYSMNPYDPNSTGSEGATVTDTGDGYYQIGG